jgi:hypothetical protein
VKGKSSHSGERTDIPEAVRSLSAERVEALARRVTVGIVTALPKEFVAAPLDSPEFMNAMQFSGLLSYLPKRKRFTFEVLRN